MTWWSSEHDALLLFSCKAKWGDGRVEGDGDGDAVADDAAATPPPPPPTAALPLLALSAGWAVQESGAGGDAEDAAAAA